MCSPEIETNPIHVPRHTMTIHVHKRQARATAKAPILSLPLHLGFFASSDCWKTSIYSIPHPYGYLNKGIIFKKHLICNKSKQHLAPRPAMSVADGYCSRASDHW